MSQPQRGETLTPPLVHPIAVVAQSQPAGGGAAGPGPRGGGEIGGGSEGGADGGLSHASDDQIRYWSWPQPVPQHTCSSSSLQRRWPWLEHSSSASNHVAAFGSTLVSGVTPGESPGSRQTDVHATAARCGLACVCGCHIGW